MSAFLIPTLLSAGFTRAGTAQLDFAKLTSTGGGPDNGTLFGRFKQHHSVTLASHSSHSSHASHASHRSGSGGYDYGTYPTYPVYSVPTYVPPAPTSPPVPSQPSTAAPLYSAEPQPGTDKKLPALSGRSKKFASIVRRVQIGLLAQGDYDGAINGVVTPLMREALRKFQGDHSLPVTGTITPETLDALRVSSD